MKSLRWILGMAVLATGWAVPVDLSAPSGVLGYASTRGHALYQVEYQSLDAGDGLKLPLRYVFSSDPKAGMGWDIPLLTARATEYNPMTRYGYFEVKLICGKKLHFQFVQNYNPTNGKMFMTPVAFSDDRQWRAEVTGVPTSAGQEEIPSSSPHNFTLTITRWDGWSLYFSNGGFLQTLTTDTGKTLRWNYNGSNQVTTITVPATSTTLLSTTYASSKLTEIRVNGDLYQPLTNYLGQLEQITRPDGTKDLFTYVNFSSANLGSYGNTSNPSGGNASVEHTNRYGETLKLTWDPLNHFLVSDGSWTYQVTKPASWIVDSSNNVTDYAYGAPGVKRTRTATGEWEEIIFQGDRDSSRTIRGVDGSETRITEFKTFGPVFGKITKVEKKIAGSWVSTYLAAYEQTTGRPLRWTDAYGKDTVYIYTNHPTGSLPQPWSGSTILAPPKTITVTDPTSRWKIYEYDPRGNLVSFNDGSNVVHTYEYDSRDRVKKVWNDAGTLVAQFDYNNNDRIISFKDAPLNETVLEYLNRYGESHLTKFTYPSGLNAELTYDAKGNRTSIKGFNAETWTLTPNADNLLEKITDPLLQETDFTYDGRKNLATVTDALNQQTSAEYDDLDLPKKLTDPLTYYSQFQNNGDGQTKQITDNRFKVYDLEYANRRQRTKLRFPGASENVSTYDLNERLSSWKNRANTTVSVGRDDAGRVTSWNWSGGYGATFTYDAAGRFLTANTTYPAATVQKSFTYDGEGRLSTATQDGRTVTFHYNNDDRISSVDYPAGFTLTYLYDSDGRLQYIRRGSGTIVAQFSYDTKGRLASRRDQTGSIYTNYTYDPLDRITQIKVQRNVSGSFTTIWQENYTYDVVGNRVSTIGSNYSGGVGDVYGYDNSGQLTGVKYGATNPQDGYSAATSPARTEVTVYDAAGNRATRTDLAGVTGYTVNDLNQYTTVTGESPSYDGQGNLTAHDGWQLAYSPLGQLVSAQKAGVTLSYGYDAFGNRAYEANAGNYTRRLFYVGHQLIESYEVNGSTTGQATTYVPGEGIDRPVCRIIDQATYPLYFHQDALGSIAVVTASSAVQERYVYDAWGKFVAYDGYGAALLTPPNRFLFTGRDYDVETGLYHYRSRAYSPKLGRFLQPDTIDFYGGGLNIYQYVFNNPQNFTDPFGFGVWESTATQGMHYNDRNSKFGFALSTEGGRVIPVPLGGKHTFDQKMAQNILNEAMNDKKQLEELRKQNAMDYDNPSYRDKNRCVALGRALRLGGIFGAALAAANSSLAEQAGAYVSAQSFEELSSAAANVAQEAGEMGMAPLGTAIVYGQLVKGAR